MTGRRDQGFALITALWAALILALLAAYAIQATRAGARVTRTEVEQAELRAAAEAIATETELRLLAPTVTGLPLDGTVQHLRFGRRQAELRVQDQAGLIDLNFVDDPTLLHLLTSLGGLELSDAQTMTDRILDWRERGAGRRLQGAKAPDYAEAGIAYGPREAPFESVGELKLVLGMTRVLYARIAPALTVHSQKPIVDRNVAPEAVLLALPGTDPDSVVQALEARQKLDDSGSLVDGDLTGRSLGIAVSVRNKRGARVSCLTVVRLTGNLGMPLWTYFAEQL